MAQVTGGSAGIGKAAALAFGANGARVAVMGRRKERLDSVVDQLPGGLAVVGDLTVPEDCQRAIEETVAAFGGLDILVNNGAPSELIDFSALLYSPGHHEYPPLDCCGQSVAACGDFLVENGLPYKPVGAAQLEMPDQQSICNLCRRLLFTKS